MRRVYRSREALWQNLLLWPHTLRIHGRKAWSLSWAGAVFLFLGSYLTFHGKNISACAQRKAPQDDRGYADRRPNHANRYAHATDHTMCRAVESQNGRPDFG